MFNRVHLGYIAHVHLVYIVHINVHLGYIVHGAGFEARAWTRRRRPRRRGRQHGAMFKLIEADI